MRALLYANSRSLDRWCFQLEYGVLLDHRLLDTPGGRAYRRWQIAHEYYGPSESGGGVAAVIASPHQRIVHVPQC